MIDQQWGYSSKKAVFMCVCVYWYLCVVFVREREREIAVWCFFCHVYKVCFLTFNNGGYFRPQYCVLYMTHASGQKSSGEVGLWTTRLLWLYNNIVHLIIVHSNRTSASTGLPEQKRHFTVIIMPSYGDFTQYFFKQPRWWSHWLKSCADTCFSLGKCSPLDSLERKKDLGNSDGPQIIRCQLASKK